MENSDKAAQFEKFKEDVRKALGEALVGEVGPDKGQYAFCTSEVDEGPDAKAKSVDAVMEIKSRYPALARCAVMPFPVSGRIIYVMANV